MINKLIKEYKDISEEIEKENKSELDRLISSLATSILNKPKEPDDYGKQHRVALFSLLCLRIAINSQLIYYGYIDNKKKLQKDISDALENAGNIECEYTINDNVVYDTLEIIYAISPLSKEIVRNNLQYKFSSHSDNNKVSQNLYFLFKFTSDYYKQIGRDTLAYALLEQLCNISRERNSLELHQEIISRVLGWIGESAPKVTCRIGNIDNDKFAGVINVFAGDFFWAYACALSKMENRADAEKFFRKCYNVRKIIYGEDNWLTAIAKREYSIVSWSYFNEEVNLEFLLKFIDNIENGCYKEIDKDLCIIIEGKTLAFVLVTQCNTDKFIEYYSYLKIYEKICNQYDGLEPFIHTKIAKNLRGAYYIRTGDYIQAEKMFIDAIDIKAPKETSEFLNESLIKINLLMSYYVQNDLDKAIPLLNELLDLIDNEKENKKLSLQTRYMIYTLLVSIEIQAMIKLSKEEIEDLKALVCDVCTEINKKSLSMIEYYKEAIIFILCSLELFLENGYINKTEQEICLKALNKIEQDKDFFKFNKNQQTILYFISVILAWNLNHSKIEFYIKKSLVLCENKNTPKSIRSTIYRIVAIYYRKKNNLKKKKEYLNKALSELKLMWQSYVRYLNDIRLLQILLPAQIQFSGCYAVLRKDMDLETAYEKLLQFKELASLAGKERNLIIQSGQVDNKLLEAIQKQQDKIAALETANIFRETGKEHKNEEMELRRLETEFALLFPKKVSFTEITLERVKKAIPNNSVVVEYFFSASEYGKGQFEVKSDEDKETCIDIYIIRKENNICVLNRVTVLNGLAVMDMADEFVSILQAESNDSANMEQIEKKDNIRYELYKNLIKPILSYIENVNSLYIAPDNALINLPFEILYDEYEETLENSHTVIKIECVRDFLFDNSLYSAEKRSLIIGNPKYEVREKILGKLEKSDKEQKRSINIQERDIRELPFSELEIQRVSLYSGSPYFSEFEARKNLFLSAKGYKNIHIATHGYYDLSKETESVYSSSLMFAGIKNWLHTGKISEFYGNGIVTADEVSRMDLRSTELVVLSSCLSGMNDVYLNKGFYGMIGALSAAGVHYVVSYLWAANDFSTAIFMDAFYYQYMDKRQSPEIALAKAKQYLRNITIGQLKQQGWFESIKQIDLSYEYKELIEKYEEYNDRVRPFKNEAFWGGFVCYRCN